MCNGRLLETLISYELHNPSLEEWQFAKHMQTLHLFLNILIWIPLSSLFTLPSRPDMELHWCSHTEEKKTCQATPSAPAQDAPAYKKAPATSRRVDKGRHLGDSPTERVSPWKWCQQQSVVVERLLWWCLRNLGEDFLSYRQRVMERVDEPCTVLICRIKHSLPRAFPLHVEWSECYCPAECSIKLSMSCSLSMYGLILLSIGGTTSLSQRGFQN